jgi:hypothetical protein
MEERAKALLLTIPTMFFRRSHEPPKSSRKELILGSPYISDKGKLVAERLMCDDALVFERLFSYLGELESRIAILETRNRPRWW